MKYKQDYNDSTVISVIKFLNSKWREVIYTDFEKNIKLFSITQLVNSNTITILIDCFLCEDKKLINEWEDFMKFFYNETMFYYFGWQSLEKDILKNKNFEEIKKESKNIIDAFNRAKLCGKILAYILISSKFFKDFQINLVGYSLGNVVLKHCIKELAKLHRIDKNNFVNLKNVILIAAATHIKKSRKMERIFEEIIINKFINCYSKNDFILEYLYKICSKEKAIGNDNLIINNNNSSNLVSNYDFTKDNYGHFSYKFRIVAEKIFNPYKDI